jgi:hypothetical protein
VKETAVKRLFDVKNEMKTFSDKFSCVTYIVGTRNKNRLHVQSPNFHVFREVHTVPASAFLTLYHLVSEVLCIKRHNLSQHYKDI